MSKRWNRTVNRTVLQLLTWIGIGSTSMLFMACYGPAPQDYRVVEDEDSLLVMEGDSVVMSTTFASDSVDVAEVVSQSEPEVE